METTKNKLPDKIEDFYRRLREYLDTPLYFYGSVQRNDYIPGKSDIDVCLFSDNMKKTTTRLEHFLQIPSSHFKQFVFQDRYHRVYYGSKAMYHNAEMDFYGEFSIYNEKDKHFILRDKQAKITLPFYISWALSFIKCLYYHCEIIDKKTYKQWKNRLLAFNNGYKTTPFVIID